MNCSGVKQQVLRTFAPFSSQQIADEIQRRGFGYPSEIMNSGFTEQQKQNTVLNMLGEYEQSKCNRASGMGYSLYGGIKKNKKSKRRKTQRKSQKKSKTRRRH